MEPLELRTHTRLWQVERRLYKLYDYTLPMPVSLRMLGIFFSTTVPWFMLMSLVNVPFAPPFGHLLWLAPPAILAWYANKPVAEGKRLGELLVSQVIFLAQAKNYAGLRPFRPDTTIRATGAVWKRLGDPDLDPNANPTPGLTAGPSPDRLAPPHPPCPVPARRRIPARGPQPVHQPRQHADH